MPTYLSSNRTTNNACRTGYTLDAADRRIRAALPDGSAWDYGYDDLGQLTSAQRDSINAMAYVYDTIGNRQTATEDAATTAYTANDLNQYTAINQEQPTYDADGNMLTNGGWTYTWNAENRLIRAENGPLKVEANYDYLGRRFEKKVFYGNTLTQHQYFIYDGYKLAAILDALDENKITTTFTWQPTGPDTPLTMTHKGETGYYLTDGNKNVLKVVKSDGTELATYTYSPFGQTLSATGPWANINPFRFSSEYHDTETGLIYYNYRHYSPILGRWLSRDPIEEIGGVNLYGMVGNNPVNYSDHLGYLIDINPVVDLTNWVGKAVWDGTVCIAEGVVKTVETVFDDSFPVIGSVTGPLGDIGKGIGYLAVGEVVEAGSSVWDGTRKMVVYLAADVAGTFYGQTVGRWSAYKTAINLYGNEGFWGNVRNFGLPIIIPFKGYYTGPLWGATQEELIDGQLPFFREFFKIRLRDEFTAYLHDWRLESDSPIFESNPGLAHLKWIKDVWTVDGIEPGPFGQVYKFVGTPFFLVFTLAEWKP